MPYMSDDSALATSNVKKRQLIPPSLKTWKYIGMNTICDLSESENGYNI